MKLQEILEELTHRLQRRKKTKMELLSLIGKLAFAGRAVPAGHLFLHRLVTLSTKVRCLHHHLRLNREARADISGGIHSCQPGMGQQLFSIQKPQMLRTWSSSPMRQAPLDVGLTSRVLGFIMSGSHIRECPQKYPFNGKSFLPYLQQPSHGATSGRVSASGLIVTTRPLC